MYLCVYTYMLTTGLEPALYIELDFKSSVSTISPSKHTYKHIHTSIQAHT